MAKVLTDDNFEQEALKSDLPCIVDFYADWCAPCKMMAPVMEELSAQYEGKFNIFKVNVDDAGKTASKYGIMSIPTMIIFKDGEIADTITGAVPKNVIEETIKVHM